MYGAGTVGHRAPVWLASALLVAACSAPLVNQPTLPTLEPARPGVAEGCGAQLFGPAVLEERLGTPKSPVVAISAGGEVMQLVWHRKYVAEFSPLVIRDQTGAVVAEGGDRVWLTGGGAEGGGYYVCDVSLTGP